MDAIGEMIRPPEKKGAFVNVDAICKTLQKVFLEWTRCVNRLDPLQSLLGKDAIGEMTRPPKKPSLEYGRDR